MTKERVIEINAETDSYESALSQMWYELGFEYFLKSGNVDNGEGLDKVFGMDFMRGFMAAKRTPKHLLKMATA